MIPKILIIDDCVSKAYQDAIESTIVQNLDLPWYYSPTATEDNLVGTSDSYGFSHGFYNPHKGGKTSDYTDFLMPLCFEGADKISFYVNTILNGRIFMTLPQAEKTKHNRLHTDSFEDHLVCLYYVNDSTGPTYITNFTNKEVNSVDVNNIEIQNYQQIVHPKKGRMVFFSGQYYHASSNPEIDRRCIINFNVR